MNDAHREAVTRLWSGLEAEQVSGTRRLRVAPLPVDSVNGPLSVAVDAERHRHLLVPIESSQRVRRGLAGPVLVLRRRPLEDEHTYQVYADLGCLRPDLNDLFTLLCADVLRVAESFRANPIKGLYRVLDRWKALFEAEGAQLGAEQVAGLFGELTVLTRVLQTDPSAHRLWLGPSGHRHDFSDGTSAVEVKTTIGDDRQVRIHGLDQLEAPASGELLLAWFRLARSDHAGESLPGLVERALSSCDDESVLLETLARAGYRPSDDDAYRDSHFVLRDERWYAVDARFPKLAGNDLMAAGIQIAVMDVAYTVDLSLDPPTPLGRDRVDRHLDVMIRGA